MPRRGGAVFNLKSYSNETIVEKKYALKLDMLANVATGIIVTSHALYFSLDALFKRNEIHTIVVSH